VETDADSDQVEEDGDITASGEDLKELQKELYAKAAPGGGARTSFSLVLPGKSAVYQVGLTFCTLCIHPQVDMRKYVCQKELSTFECCGLSATLLPVASI
jgi:hypothetical protein